MRKNTKLLTLAVILAGLASCGLATSDAERMQRAEDQIASGAYRTAIIELKNILANDASNVDARLRLAEVSLGLGDVLTAEKELSRATDLGAPASEIVPLHFRILAEKRQFNEMLAALAEEIDGLTAAQQLSYRGQALLGTGNATEAATAYRDWLALEADSADAKTGLAYSMAAAGNLGEARAVLDEVLGSYPEHVDALLALGLLNYQSGTYDEALLAFQSAVDAVQPQANIPKYVRILIGLADTQLMLESLEDARKTIQRLASVMPEAPVTLFLSARLARSENDYALAARHLQSLLNVNPGNSQAQLFLASVQIAQGNNAQAQSLLNRIVAKAPDNFQARKMLAQVQINQSQLTGAVEVLAPMLDEQQEADPGLLNLLAQIDLQGGDAQSAIRNFEAAAAADPDSMQAKINLAAAYLNAGEADLALEQLAGVTSTNDEVFRKEQLLIVAYLVNKDEAGANEVVKELLAARGEVSAAVVIASGFYSRTGNADKARQLLQDFSAANPEDTAVLLNLGRLELVANRLEKAVGYFEAVKNLDRDSLAAALGLARIAELSEDIATATKLLEQATLNHPQAVGPRAWLANRYLSEGKLKEARKMAGDALKIGYRSAVISDIVGRVLLASGEADEALLQFETGVRLAPRSAAAHINLARAYATANQTVKAHDALKTALEIQPDSVQAKAALVLVQLRQGQMIEALQNTAELRTHEPENVALMALEGEVLLYQQDYVGAAAAFHRAVESGGDRRAMFREFQARANGKLPKPDLPLLEWLDDNPDSPYARQVLAEYYQVTDARDEAAREYEKLLEADPENARFLNNLAVLYQLSKNLVKAEALALRARSLDKESGSIADTLGWIYRDLGRHDDSLALLQEGSRRSPEDGEIKYHLATVLSEAGQKDEARKILTILLGSEIQFTSRAAATELLKQL